MHDEITDRVERLSPQTRALFWEIQARGEEADFRGDPEELVPNLGQRMLELPKHDQAEFVELFRVIGRQAYEEGLSLQAEGIQYEGFAKLIERAQELERRAGRAVNEDMTLREAIAKLEAAGELDPLERGYLQAFLLAEDEE